MVHLGKPLPKVVIFTVLYRTGVSNKPSVAVRKQNYIIMDVYSDLENE